MSEQPQLDLEERARCDNCRFFKVKGQKCRRYPPQTVFDLNDMKRTPFFPQVNVGMWCGEHQPESQP